MNGLKNIPVVMQTEDWRKLFQTALDSFPEDKVLYRELSSIDPFYDTAEGKQELDNVRYNKAGITKTARAVKTLEKWFDLQKSSNVSKIIKRQKLHVPQKSS